MTSLTCLPCVLEDERRLQENNALEYFEAQMSRLG